MYITSYGISLPCPSGRRIYGDVPSQFTGSKPHDGGELLVNGKPMGPDFPHRKREQYLGYVPLLLQMSEAARGVREERKQTERHKPSQNSRFTSKKQISQFTNKIV